MEHLDVVLDAIVNPSHLLGTASFSECCGVLCTCRLDQAYGSVFICLTVIEVAMPKEYLVLLLW